MLAGVPLIAYRAGCLDASCICEAGIVLRQDDDFASRAVEQVQLRMVDPDSFVRASKAASAQALAQTQATVPIARRLAETIADRDLW